MACTVMGVPYSSSPFLRPQQFYYTALFKIERLLSPVLVEDCVSISVKPSRPPNLDNIFSVESL